jgi:predicted enzyme involved in methoxymalonyl-ACP biosynthesis
MSNMNFSDLNWEQVLKQSKRFISGPKLHLSLVSNVHQPFWWNGIMAAAVPFQLNLELTCTPFEELEESICNPQSPLYYNAPDGIVLSLNTEKEWLHFTTLSPEEKTQFCFHFMERMERYTHFILTRGPSALIITNLVELDDFSAQIQPQKPELSFIYQVRKINLMLMERFGSSSRIALLDLQWVQNQVGRKDFLEHREWMLGPVGLGRRAAALAGLKTVGALARLNNSGVKMILIHTDFMLWSGILSQDDASMCSCLPNHEGRPFYVMQHLLLNLKNAGMKLACYGSDDLEQLELACDELKTIIKISDFTHTVFANLSPLELVKLALNQEPDLKPNEVLLLDYRPDFRAEVQQSIPGLLALNTEGLSKWFAPVLMSEPFWG